MSLADTITVNIRPEAAAHVRTLGLKQEFDQMVEQALRAVPGLRELRVSLTFDMDGVDEPRVQLLVIKDAVDDPASDDTEWQWGAWMTARFSPDVFRHFVLLTAYGTVA